MKVAPATLAGSPTMTFMFPRMAVLSPVLAQTHLVSATYIGTLGSRYAFYSVATDANGNRELPPGTPDAETLVNLTNSPPSITLPNFITLIEGETWTAVHCVGPGHRAGADGLAGRGAPPGVSLNVAGAADLATGEGNGPSTNF